MPEVGRGEIWWGPFVLISCAFSGSNLLNWCSRFGGLPRKLQAVLGYKLESHGEISAVCSVVYIYYQLCTQRLGGVNVVDALTHSGAHCFYYFQPD